MKKYSLQKKRKPAGRTFRAALLLTLAVFFLPALVFGGNARAESTEETTLETTQAELTATKSDPEEEELTTEAAEKLADSQTLKVKVGSQVKKMKLEEYIWGVVAAEMPASFEEEALKAQAIAARTYTLYRMEYPSPNHTDADICTDPACCQAWISYKDRMAAWSESKQKEYAGKITTAVTKTKGKVLYYEDKPIMAAFHASSAGVTKSAKEVWGKDLPYLQAVKSPETEEQVPNYYSVVTVKATKFQKALLQAYPKAKLGSNPKKWFGKVTYDAGKLPVSIQIGGVTVPTSALRQLFELRSSSVTLEADGKEIRLYVTGYGHGVGMSQYGANALAKKGKKAQDILTHYYTGVTIRSLSS